MKCVLHVFKIMCSNVTDLEHLHAFKKKKKKKKKPIAFFGNIYPM